MAKLSLGDVLGEKAAQPIEQMIAQKLASKKIEQISDPKHAMKFMRANLCGSYLFSYYTVPMFGSVVLQSLVGTRPPVDDERGHVIKALLGLIEGEICNNAIYGREGECHSHYHDIAEAYEAAHGDMEPVEKFITLHNRDGFIPAIRQSTDLWSAGAIHYATELIRHSNHWLIVFVHMAVNEILSPLLYEKVLQYLPEHDRFQKFTMFLSKHVELDGDEHADSALKWLQLFLADHKTDPLAIEIAVSDLLFIMNPPKKA